MKPGGPAIAQLLLQSAAREGEPAPVDERAALVWAGDPDQQRCGVGQVAKPFFAFAPGRIGPQGAEFGNIGPHNGKAGRMACRVAQPGAATLNPPAVAFRRQDAAFEERLAAAGRNRRFTGQLT